jgi:hypothetical protein
VGSAGQQNYLEHKLEQGMHTIKEGSNDHSASDLDRLLDWDLAYIHCLHDEIKDDIK